MERSIKNYPSMPMRCARAVLRLQKGEREKACYDLTVAKALANIRMWTSSCSSIALADSPS
ncbi:MAG: hypothetical protein IPJ85_14220 [Flavobacteriales bacterium]|nr:hypothetical protein [Flavobacteriales bacterium]